MNPRAIKPVIIKVMPKPFRGAGTFEYAIFSLIAAIATIAKNHPTPEPNARIDLQVNRIISSYHS